MAGEPGSGTAGAGEALRRWQQVVDTKRREAARRGRSLLTPMFNRALADTSLVLGQRRLAIEVHQARLDATIPPRTTADRNLLALAPRLVPTHAPVAPLVRIGGAADGGYVMAAALDGTTGLSIGVGWDDSWDRGALAAGAAQVWQFDHTITRPPTPLAGSTFLRLGVAGSDQRPQQPLVPLDTMWALAGSPGEVTLKMDVEGAEWESLDGEAVSTLAASTQLAMEWHGWQNLADEAWTSRVHRVLDRLSQSHVLVLVTANNAAGLVSLGALSFPYAIEVTYVRRDLAVPLADPPPTLRHPLARPNEPRLPSIDLDPLLLTAPRQ